MTSTNRFRNILLAAGLALLALTAAVAIRQAYARSQAAPAVQASPMHPTFLLLDKDGSSVVESQAPLSTEKTCGQCHDTAYIASHSFHIDLGRKDQAPAGQVPGGQPWDTSPGLYGKWNPLTYRYLSPEGDARVDLDPAGWVKFNAARLVGGGPADQAGYETDCFLCHFTRPNNAERIQVIEAGKPEWAAAATLLGSGIVERSGEAYAYNQAAFKDTGELDPLYVTLQDPSNDNCAQCHGVVHTDVEQPLALTGCSLDQTQTAATGQVISGQKISTSGSNISGKAGLARSFDIHAERGLQCTDCHFSLNNPSFYQKEAGENPSHLQYDPRRLEIGEYLQKPDHNFARGQSAQYNVAPELKGTMRRCETCHNADTHADWLPYVDRHMQEVSCESCHIPKMYAPAVQSYDWTVLKADGSPVSQCRGVDGQSGTLNDLVTGFEPALLQRSNIDGRTVLAPYNLVSSWYWVYASPNGPRPVSQDDLKAAYLAGGAYAPEVLSALDANGDGQLAEDELKLDSQSKAAVIAARLSGLGLQNPRIEAQVQPYSINHGVTNGEFVTKDCQSCHTSDSRLTRTTLLAGYVPGGVQPEFVKDNNTSPTGSLYVDRGQLYYRPVPQADGLYVFGHNRVGWIDTFGVLFFAAVLLGVGGHGGLRFYNALRRPRHAQATRKVYMYHVYERFWHWLQTTTIVLLLFTGLVIHRPDVLGWLSFRYMVTLHNVLAAVLVVNAALSLFYHLVSGEIQQYIPRPYGFFDQAIVQAKFYLNGIFKGGEHPFEKAPGKKLNPLQQATYFGILNVLLPLQIITGALMWGTQRWPEIAGRLGGLPFLAPFHSLVAWTFAAFIVGHVYLTTTGHEPLTGIKAMVNGWEDVETPGEPAPEAPVEPAAPAAASSD
ncbi:MAG: cytochrome b/b6 domain-containing protein [Chloroflexota bacterium]